MTTDTQVDETPHTPLSENHHEAESPPDLVTVIELADRWDIDKGGVMYRLKTRGIARFYTADGKVAVRESDLALQDFSTYFRKSKSPAETSSNGASIEVAKPEVTPPPEPEPLTRELVVIPPIVGEIALLDPSEDKIRRLLLALKTIEELTQDADTLDGFAVYAVAKYAIRAEGGGDGH